MISERDFSAGELAALKEAQIVIASNMTELKRKARGMPDSKKINLAGSDLEALMRAWGLKPSSWGSLKGKRVLDLASGSAISIDNAGHVWYPHFARLCAINGASVTTIDVHEQTGFDATLLHGVRSDIVRPVMQGRLAGIEGVGQEKYDVIFSNAFAGENPSPLLLLTLQSFGIKIADFRKAFFDQSVTLLAEGGIMKLGLGSEIEGADYNARKDGDLIRLQSR